MREINRPAVIENLLKQIKNTNFVLVNTPFFKRIPSAVTSHFALMSGMVKLQNLPDKIWQNCVKTFKMS